MSKIVIFVREIRKAEKIPVRTLARLSGINAVRLVRIETGRESPRLNTLLKLSCALGVNIKDLFVVLNN